MVGGTVMHIVLQNYSDNGCESENTGITDGIGRETTECSSYICLRDKCHIRY